MDNGKQTSLAEFGFISKSLLPRQTKLKEFDQNLSDSESKMIDQLKQLFGPRLKEDDPK